MTSAQTNTPATLRTQLRAPYAHLGLRLAIVCAGIASFLGALVTIAEYAHHDPILFALLIAASLLATTTLSLFLIMLTDLLDALLVLYASPPEPRACPDPQAPGAALDQLRATTAYWPLRKLLLLCYVLGAIASLLSSVITISCTIFAGLVAYLFARAITDAADALLIVQSRRIHAPLTAHFAAPPR
jgi:hypothetical protein